MLKNQRNVFESLESRVLFAAGDLDVALNNGHIVTTAFKAGGTQISDVATMPDGGVIAVGQLQVLKKGTLEAVVAEYNFDGSLNTAFGTGGEVIGLPGGLTFPDNVQVGSDGSIYLLSTGVSTMTKLTANGAVDTTFGSKGVLTFPEIRSVTGFALDSSNNILVAGTNQPAPSDELVTTNGDLRRYTSSGKIDASFHGGADFILAPVGTTDVQGQYRTLTFGTPAIDSQGRILITAEDSLHANHDSGHIDVTNDYVYRLTSAGKIDRTFGSSGNVKLADGSASIVGQLGNGQILITINGHLSRYNSTGTLDTNYGTNGIVTLLDFTNDINKDFAVATDGSLTVIAPSTDPNINFNIEHVLPNGALDTDFGDNGLVSPTALGASNAYSVALAPDGTAVIGGGIGALSPSGKVDTRTFAFARLYTGKGPALQLVPRTLKTKSRYLSMTVLIRDNETVKLSTLDNNDLKLFDSDGSTRKIRLLNTTDVNGDGRYIQATYRIVAPNNDATWLAADNGQYEVRLQKQQVADGNSNFAEAQILGTLGVKIV